MHPVGPAQREEPLGGGSASAKALRRPPRRAERGDSWGARGQIVQAFVVRGGHRFAQRLRLLPEGPSSAFSVATPLNLIRRLASCHGGCDGPDQGWLLPDSEAWEELTDGNSLHPVGVSEDWDRPGEVTASAMPSQDHWPRSCPGLVAPTPPSPSNAARMRAGRAQ